MQMQKKKKIECVFEMRFFFDDEQTFSAQVKKSWPDD